MSLQAEAAADKVLRLIDKMPKQERENARKAIIARLERWTFTFNEDPSARA